ncbi:MAG: prohibitin family protein [Elusimicrobiota bacterium]
MNHQPEKSWRGMGPRCWPVAAAVAICGCASIGPGRVGLLWRASNGTQQKTYSEGLHVVAPWNQMYIYNLRTMSHNEVLNVIASNGLAIRLDATVRYHLKRDQIVALQREIGPNYYDVILEPLLRSDARRVFGRYTPEEIYSTKRDVIEKEIREGLDDKLKGKHISLEAVLIRNVELPEAIRRAIDEKLAAEQDVLKMKYIIQVAQAQADKKRIEAQGIADYNKAIAGSISPAILQFERIQELDKLAQSSNAKTIVISPEVGSKVLLTAGQKK